MSQYRFRLLSGSHVQDTDGVATQYGKGDVFPTDDAAFKKEPGRYQDVSKDDRVKVSKGIPVRQIGANLRPENLAPAPVVATPSATSATPTPPTPSDDGATDTLSSMTVHELQAYAKSQEIDISKAKNKAEIVETIRSAEAE